MRAVCRPPGGNPQSPGPPFASYMDAAIFLVSVVMTLEIFFCYFGCWIRAKVKASARLRHSLALLTRHNGIPPQRLK